MGFEIFRSNSDHYDGMFEVHSSCFDGNELMNKNLFIEEVTNATRVYYVVLNEGKVVGYAGAWNTEGDYSIISVATDKNYRRQGIATKLIKRLILDAKEKNINALSLEVNEHNTGAIELYRRLGFIITNVRENYYKDKASAYIMWLYL